jgi:hypothetical protein
MILEHKDTQFLKVTELADRSPLALRVSGLAFHSGLAVDRITIQTRGSSLTIYVHLTPARAGLSGSFEHEVEIPTSVNEVQFGNSEVVIWRRN